MSEAVPGGPPATLAGELLTFGLDHEVFALEVARVREVVDPMPATQVPNAPDFAPALVNVRGNVVPLVDLRRKLDMLPLDSGDPRIVVAEVALAGEPALVGILTDAVYGVVDAAGAELRELPRLGTRWRGEFIRGVLKQDAGFVVVLDLERILARPERASGGQDFRE
jgi:purine-binding chemotaxis protein CheW